MKKVTTTLLFTLFTLLLSAQDSTSAKVDKVNLLGNAISKALVQEREKNEKQEEKLRNLEKAIIRLQKQLDSLMNVKHTGTFKSTNNERISEKDSSNQPKYIYCELSIEQWHVIKKVITEIDMGQESSYWNIDFVTDQDGNAIQFNSRMDALNYFGKDGWVIDHSYEEEKNNLVGNKYTVYHYVMRKKV
jgi:hypothetical protein